MMESLKKLSLWRGSASILLVCVTLLSGCSTFGFKKSDPITVGQVIQMSKDDVPPETIVKKMQDSESVYRFTAAQLAELHDMGVGDPVLNYMQQTISRRSVDSKASRTGTATAYGDLMIGKEIEGKCKIPMGLLLA